MIHEYLSIVVGFPKDITDAGQLADSPVDALVLTGSKGFMLDPVDGWQPQSPTLKGGGVWAESSTSNKLEDGSFRLILFYPVCRSDNSGAI